MKFCKKCCYSDVTVNLRLNDEGICSSCITSEKLKNITEQDWEKRKQKLKEILNKRKKNHLMIV